MTSTSLVRICDVPTEVLLSIFSFLPVVDLARCAATCERWHDIVKGFTYLWRGKGYRSFSSPAVCRETSMVLHALPPLQEVTIDSDNGFVLSLRYPRLSLSVKYISVMDDCPRLSCTYMSARLDIVGDILSHGSTIVFDRLRHLRILQVWTHNTWAPLDYSADYAVRTSLRLCPNLTHLSVNADFLSPEYLCTVEELGRLRALEMECLGVQQLSFLRHCSERLEQLQLLRCCGLPSRELAQLAGLRQLRHLRLGDFQFDERELAAAVAALGSLESLQLNRCSSVRDLSFLQHCAQLRKLCITSSRFMDPLKLATPEGLRLGDLQLLAATNVRSVRAVGVVLTESSLPAALTRLERMGLNGTCVTYLAALCGCPQLRHVCCDFARGHKLFNVRIHITVTIDV